MIYLACEKKMLLKYFVRVRSPRLYLALHEQWVGPGLPLFSGRVTSLLARPPVIVHRVRLGPPRFFSRSLNSLLISTFHLILLPDHVFEMRVQFFSHYFSIAILLHHMFPKCMHNYFFIAFQSPSLSSLQLVDFSGETTDVEKQRRKRHQRKTQEMHSFVLRESPWRIFCISNTIACRRKKRSI